jgi:hypothetical protein
MGSARVTRDVVELDARVELYGPKRRPEVVRRDRELGEGNTASCAPEDDATATLWRAIDTGLQHTEAHLISYVADRDHVHVSGKVRRGV